MYKRLWRQASLSIGAPLGNMEGGSPAGDFERWMKGTLKNLNGEGLEGGSFTGDPGRR